MSLFLCLLGILLGQYCQKNVAIGEGFRKKISKRGWPYSGLSIQGAGGGVSKPSAHYD